jgi:hypothetical protein
MFGVPRKTNPLAMFVHFSNPAQNLVDVSVTAQVEILVECFYPARGVYSVQQLPLRRFDENRRLHGYFYPNGPIRFGEIIVNAFETKRSNKRFTRSTHIHMRLRTDNALRKHHLHPTILQLSNG